MEYKPTPATMSAIVAKCNSQGVDIDWSSVVRVSGQYKAVFKCRFCSDESLRGINSFIKRGVFTCKSCNELALRRTLPIDVKDKIAKIVEGSTFNVDLDRVVNVGNSLAVEVECSVCGDVSVRRAAQLSKNKKITCRVCSYNQTKQKLLSDGFMLTSAMNSRGLDNNKAVCKCIKCGEEKIIDSADIFRTKPDCDNCRIVEVSNCLTKRGCILKDAICVKNKQKRIRYLCPDGFEREAYVSSILNMSFASSESPWDNKFSVYCFKSNNTDYPFLKVGIANDPHVRLSRLKLPFECDVLVLDSFDNRNKAQKVEREIHEKLSDFKVGTEVTDVFSTRASHYKRADGSRGSYKDGATEWFEIDAFELLMNTLENIKETHATNLNSRMPVGGS
jgi:hypothetical protein